MLEDSLTAKRQRAFAAGPGLQCTLSKFKGGRQAMEFIDWKSIFHQFCTDVFARHE